MKFSAVWMALIFADMHWKDIYALFGEPPINGDVELSISEYLCDTAYIGNIKKNPIIVNFVCFSTESPHLLYNCLTLHRSM